MQNILVVIRDEALRGKLSRLLALQGHRVELTRDTCDLRDALTRPIDLLVADMNAASTNGIEVVQVVKRLNPGAKCIGLSGSSLQRNTDYRRLLVQLNVDFLLHEPIADGSIERTVSALLQWRAMEAASPTAERVACAS